jgi:integrase
MRDIQSPLAGVAPTTSGALCENHAAGPAPSNAPLASVGDLIEAYMATYAGRDRARLYRLTEWKALLGTRPLAGLTDDDLFHAIESIAAQPARIFMGYDADRRPIHRAKGQRSPATVNRYRSTIAAVFTWAIKKRRAPKGWKNPCGGLDSYTEANAVVRFLSPEERARLLAACKAAGWPRLYALVLMAITTGARRGELQRLRWSDIELDRAQAHVRALPGEHVSKNGDAKVLPLVPAVVEALSGFRARDAQRFKLALANTLVFHSAIKPDVAFNFEAQWRQALKDGRIAQFRFHDLRHTCASYLAQEGASLLEIADVMGHRQLAMVKRYAHLTVKTKTALVNRVLGDIR